jgi:DNA-binding SARP family transcriptional activator/predicted ATPase
LKHIASDLCRPTGYDSGMHQHSKLLKIQTFGRVTVTWHATREPLLLAPRTEALLIYLAYQGVPIARTQLCEIFWPNESNGRARGNLRKLLTDLRKEIDDVVGSNRELVWLKEQPYWFDVHEFQRLTQAISQRESRQRSHSATDILRLAEGLRLYHGDFLANFKQPQSPVFAGWLEQEQRYWQQRAVLGLTVLIDHAVQQAQLPKATAYARRLLELDPYNEEAHGQLMRLLAHQQQRTEALEQYNRYAQLVKLEPGGKIEAELTALYQQIRNGGLPTLLMGETIKLPAEVRTTQPPLRTIPTPMTPLIGRTHLLEQLTHYLHNPSVRLITLTGEGGVGKSRVALALALAESAQDDFFIDGVSYVLLEPPAASSSGAANSAQQSCAIVAKAIAHALQLMPDVVNVPLEQQIGRYLEQRQLLLILDNFEATIESTPLLLNLLEMASTVKLLVVSRETLQAPGELVVQVEGLPWSITGGEKDEISATGHSSTNLPPALQLFMASIQRQQPDQIFDATALAQMTAICELVDGNPLAIELAAGLVGHYEYAELLTLISEDITTLHAVGRGRAQRHRSMDDVLGVSWALLTEEERQALIELCALPPCFARATAMQQSAVTPALLIALTNKSLLRTVSPGHYRLPHLVRIFVQQQHHPS